MRSLGPERVKAARRLASMVVAACALAFGAPLPVAAQHAEQAAGAREDHSTCKRSGKRAQRRARSRAARLARERKARAERRRAAQEAEAQSVETAPLAPTAEPESEPEAAAEPELAAEPEPQADAEAPATTLEQPTSEPEPEPPPTAPTAVPAAGPPVLNASRTAHAPEIDGVLDDPVWGSAQSAEAFTQKSPRPGAAASERTVLRVLYDDDAVYVAFDCDQTASPIVAQLARRDRPTESDWVSIAFDSRGEGRSAFEFSVSAAGVLVDGLRYDDGRIAREWDEIWEARSAPRAGGWSAELRIPLQALRSSPAREQSWGMQARRYVSRRQELDEWAYIPPAMGGEVSRYGRLAQLRGVDAGSLELQPFVLGSARYQPRDPAIVHERWDLRPSAGLDFKWRPAGNWALNGTINPDFGQVEADRLILNLSTTPLQFPEKRPFFLAGMDDFVTMTPIFYSRRIGRTPKAPPLAKAPVQERLYDHPEPSPIYGALKLATDLSGGFNLAALSAVTGPNRVDAVLPDGAHQARLVDPLTSYSVLRMRSELAPQLDVGLLATATVRGEPGTSVTENPTSGWATWLTSDARYPALPDPAGGEPTLQQCPEGERTPIGERCYHDAYVGSADVVWQSPSGQYAIRGQGYGSAIHDGPTRRLADGTRIASGDLGAGGALRLSKQGGEHWLLDATLGAHSRKLDFDDLGFMSRQNEARAGLYAEYRTLEPWFLFSETHTSALGYGENNLDGLDLGRGALLMEHLVFANGWTLTLGAYGTAARFDDREVGDGTALQRAALLGLVQAVSTDTRKPLVLSAQLAEERLENGSNWSAQLGLSWYPVPAAELQVVPSYTFNSGEPRYVGPGEVPGDLLFGRLDAESASVQLRAAYTFLPTLTLQSYAQLFLASGVYFDYSRFSAAQIGPRPIVHLRDLVPDPGPAVVPDFERASLVLNVVLRWEYRLGSTLYLLYVRSQDPELNAPGRQRLDPYVLGSVPATHLFMVKLAYWLG